MHLKLSQIMGITLLLLTASCAKPGAKFEAPAGAENYIVVMRENAVTNQSRSFFIKPSAEEAVGSLAEELSQKHQLASANAIYSTALSGALYKLSAEQAEKLKQDSLVAYVEKDQIVTINQNSNLQAQVVQQNATWGLDRIDQANLPLNQTYNGAAGEGAGVNTYVIDTGILITHKEFQGRAKSGFDFVDNDADATDCNGHGTHVSGTIASQTYGVAKKANLIAVRVLDCDGSGSMSGVIAGVEWVTKNHKSPAVANMSLGGGVSQALDDAVAASIESGVVYALAAGNESRDACGGSPARVKEAITVGATTRTDQRSVFSNYGSCVDIFAPGTDITSTWYSSDSATNTISGTSMASPHVAGVAALYLGKNPTKSPAEVLAALLKAAGSNKISDAKAGSPNLLLSSNVNSAQPPVPPSSGLKSGVAVLGLAAAKAAELNYEVNLSAGVAKLVIEISGGAGDADLYVKLGSKPTLASYNCRPFKSGNNESCAILNPQAGSYKIVVRGYSAFSGVSLKATY